MTRKQQIEGVAQQRNMCVGGKGNIITALMKEFIAGAEWADRTMIDKAYKWLKDNIEYYYYVENFDKMIEDFRKAMEE